eukprot:gnl/TRDRNA2_/TRDRNA2_62648_c0_seq1.p1 gnl/TRDRNA2_/TRDRNA2_62648_c0~~gnl/TRDRNA2_/TRDRNA2_62648_c0_seq1.p1  ORF type:complete len:131 (+),score=32.03 gnl/TRDRNA2_/TRDRNA2_62648_c0_seq1:81-473(+)
MQRIRALVSMTARGSVMSAAVRTPLCRQLNLVGRSAFLWTRSMPCLGSNTGTVKFFNSEKGFGFITAQDGQDYFCHFTAIQKDGFKSLAEGEEVEFDLVPDERKGGMKASNVTGPGGTEVKGAPRREENW